MTSHCAVVLVLLLSSSSVLAAPLNPRPWTDVRDSGETTLQEILDGVFALGKDAINDQSSEALIPVPLGPRRIDLLEVIFVSDPTAFGVYDPTNPSSLTQIFGGAATPGDRVVRVSAPPSFGWYAGTGATVLFSEDDLNTGDPKALVFAPLPSDPSGAGAMLPSGQAGWVDSLGGTTRIIAFETGTDNDFQDIVVYALIAVPEPSSVLLLGAAIAALVGLRRRGIISYTR